MAEHIGPEHSPLSSQYNDEKPNTLLLVFLTKLSASDEEKLIAHLRPPRSHFHIRTWYPSDRILRSVAPQNQYRDSQAIIYGLAIRLHRNARSHFIVADGLTKRQVEGEEIMRGEGKEISVVKVAVRPGEDDQVRVIAQRSSMTSDENIALLDVVRMFDVNRNFLTDHLTFNHDVYYRHGLQLHDMDKGFFAPDKADQLGHEAIAHDIERELAAITPFPAELVLEVASRANTRATSIEVPSNLDFTENINIFLAFRTSGEERKKLHSVLQDAVQTEYDRYQEKIKQLKGQKSRNKQDDDLNCDCVLIDPMQAPEVHLIPWNKDRSMSRRDAMQIQENTPGKQAIDILLEPLRNGNTKEASFATIFYPPSALAVARSTLKDLLREVGNQSKSCKLDHFENGMEKPSLPEPDQLEIIPSKEIMSWYDEPFYANPQPWEPTDRTINSIALFYMTNKLTKEQDRALQDEIRTFNEIEDDDTDEKVICPVPWKPGEDAEDASLEYMLEIYETVHKSDKSELPYFFVDQQSATDLTLIVMETDYYWSDREEQNLKANELLKDIEDPEFRGLRYTRIPGRDAHIVFANLSIGNMGMDEFENGSEVLILPRPGWPGHGILFDDHELEAMEGNKEE